MRALITAIVVFSLTIGICISCYYVASGFSKEMISDMEKIRAYVENDDYATAKAHINQSLKRLEKSQFLLAAIANHQEIFNIQNELLKLEQHLKDKEQEGSVMGAIEANELFDRFYNSERLTFENVF